MEDVFGYVPWQVIGGFQPFVEAGAVHLGSKRDGYVDIVKPEAAEGECFFGEEKFGHQEGRPGSLAREEV